MKKITKANEKVWRKFKETTNLVRTLGIIEKFFLLLRQERARSTARVTSDAGWRKYCMSGEKPDYIPSEPRLAYKGKSWKDLAIGYSLSFIFSDCKCPRML